MKISPLDIQDRSFKVKFLGYDKIDVTDFLLTLRRDYESLIIENMDLTKKLSGLEKDLGVMKEREAELHSCLVAARALADDALEHAHAEADLVAREAEVSSKRLIQAAEEKADSLLREARQSCLLLAQESEKSAADLRLEAHEEVEELRRELTSEVSLLRSEVILLRRQEGALRDELRGVINAHLRRLDGDDDLSAHLDSDAGDIFEEAVSVNPNGGFTRTSTSSFIALTG